MKKLLPLLIGVLIWSCKTEKDVEPATTNTFMRYFGSENSHTALLAEEADNGYTMLSNVDIPVGDLGDFKYKFRLIHTDLNGNIVWHREFPALNTSEALVDGYKASSFIVQGEGYLVIGERIHVTESGTLDRTEILLRRISFSGDDEWELFIPSPNEGNLHGRAVTLDADGNILVLGSITERITSPNDMYVAKINASTRTIIWDREYGSDNGSVVSRIFSKSQSVIWGGSVTAAGSPDIRLVVAPEDQLNSQVERTCCDPLTDENAYDFCETLGGYAFVGSSTGVSTGNDIFFTKLSPAGQILGEIPAPKDFDGLNDKGVSVCPSPDGGYMILATVTSGPSNGFGKEDIFLYKVDNVGIEEENRSINYGGPDSDEAASIRTTSDGHYLIFGTSSFGSLKKLMLLKVDANGKLGS
jgi:hypothetical protein